MTEKHKYSLEQWKLLIKEQKQSGMKVVEWCDANGYTKHAYYYWLKRIRQEALPAALDELHSTMVSPVFADVTPRAVTPDSGNLYPEMPSAVIRKNGLEVGVFSSASPDIIRMILESVKDA